MKHYIKSEDYEYFYASYELDNNYEIDISNYTILSPFTYYYDIYQDEKASDSEMGAIIDEELNLEMKNLIIDKDGHLQEPPNPRIDLYIFMYKILVRDLQAIVLKKIQSVKDKDYFNSNLYYKKLN